MASTDPSEWILLDSDLTSKLSILPAGKSHLYFELNEPGSGELSIPLDSNAASLITSGMFAQNNYRGGSRGGFFVDNIGKTYVDAAEEGGRWQSISGRGAMALLEDAIVWGNGTTETTRDFSAASQASILITLLTEAQARGGLAALTWDFSASVDSDSAAWTDSEPYTLTVGTSLLDVVRQIARSGIDFDIAYSAGSFVLSAYKNGAGTDKSNTVYFRTGVDCEEIKSDERGDGVKNALLVKYRDGFISVSDAVSIAARRRREKLLNVETAQSSSSASTIGSAEVALRKDPKKNISLKIYDGAGPRAFVDYSLGDYITLDIEGIETRYRILGIQCDYEGGTYSNIVIDLNSLLYDNDQHMARDITWLMDQWATARDSNLIEVSYWAAIGDASISYNASDFVIVGDTLYMLNSGIVLSYGLTTGIWGVPVNTTLNPNCMAAVGTDLYIGAALVVYKYDTLTGTLTNVALTNPGDPLARAVYAMAMNGTTLYASGVFTTINAVAAVNIAQLDTTTGTWSAMADAASFLSTTPSLLTMLYSNGLLYSSAGTQVQAWNGTVWTNVGSAFGGNVLTFAEYGTDLLAGGQMTNGLYIWDGATWAIFGGGVNAAVRAIAVNLTDVYAAGSFTDVGNYIARYSGGSWWQLGTGLDALVDGMILYGDDVIVAGDFTTAGDKPAQGIAMYINSFESLVDYLENSSSSFNMGAAIHAAAASAVTDSDEFPFWEDVANALRKITWANIKATLKTYFDTLYVALTGAQTIAGVKTFSSDPIIPDEAYDATAWDGSLEPPTKNAVRDKIESMGGGGTPGGSDGHVQYNNGGAFGGEADFAWEDVTKTFLVGGSNWYSALSALTGGIHVSKDAGGAFTTIVTGHSWVDSVDDFTGVPAFGADRAGGSRATPTAVLNNMGLARFTGGGYDGTTLSGARAQVLLRAAGNWSTTSHPTKIELWTTPSGSTTRAIAFTVGEDGNVDILTGKTYNVNGSPHTHADLQPIDADLTAIAGLTPSNDDVIQRKAGAWVNRTIAQLVTDIRAVIDLIFTAITGWNSVSWANPTRTSATVFTVDVDVTSIIEKGDKLKFTDTTTKYLVILSVSYSSGTGKSTITTLATSDYAFVGNPSALSWSRMEKPSGWPDYFNFAPAITGFSANPTTTIMRYNPKGRRMKIDVRQTSQGTSNATTLTLSLPATAVTIANMFWLGWANVEDNGAAQANPGVIYIASAGTVLNVTKDSTLAGFTATGGKRCAIGNIDYEW